MTPTPAATVDATAGVEASRTASGTNCRTTIQSIAPAAKPSPTGSTARKKSTKTNAGTAISGWGRLEKMLQAAARYHSSAARDEHQADRQSLGDVMNRDRHCDE